MRLSGIPSAAWFGCDHENRGVVVGFNTGMGAPPWGRPAPGSQFVDQIFALPSARRGMEGAVGITSEHVHETHEAVGCEHDRFSRPDRGPEPKLLPGPGAARVDDPVALGPVELGAVLQDLAPRPPPGSGRVRALLPQAPPGSASRRAWPARPSTARSRSSTARGRPRRPGTLLREARARPRPRLAADQAKAGRGRVVVVDGRECAVTSSNAAWNPRLETREEPCDGVDTASSQGLEPLARSSRRARPHRWPRRSAARPTSPWRRR